MHMLPDTDATNQPHNIAEQKLQPAKDILATLLNHGKIDAAIDVYERYLDDPSLLNAFTRKAFFNRARNSLVAFLTPKLEILAPTISPIIARNMVTLAEMAGSLTLMREGLNKFETIVHSIYINSESCFSDEAINDTINACLGLFRLDLAIQLINKLQSTKIRSARIAAVDRFKSVCQSAGFEVDELTQQSMAIQSGRSRRISKTTTVVRITPKIWDILAKTAAPEGEFYPDGFGFAKALKSRGYYVELAPQFSLPGPSLHTPYSTEQNFPIAFVDCHKYSKRGAFAHYKSTHTSKFLVDRSGYSGWAEIQQYPELHNFSALALDVCRDYCAKERELVFGSERIRPPEFSKFAKYIVVPLQMPGDSVQRLSKFHFFEMIDACIRFSKSKGLQLVLRRHPLCQDRELSEYLSKVKKTDGVHVTDLSTRELILHSEAVVLCNSSVGWDAILAQKPLICFGLAEYSRVAKQVDEISDLEEIENLSALVDIEAYQRLYYYFWEKYSVRRGKPTTARVEAMVADILSIKT